MTVIAWDGKTVAADRKISGSGPSGEFTKLYDLPDGRVAALFGEAASALSLLKWVMGECAEFPKDWGADGSLIIFGGGRPQVFNTRHEIPISCEDDVMAWGSGAMVAVGALAHGATAKEAVEIATRYCNGCGNGIDVRNV